MKWFIPVTFALILLTLAPPAQAQEVSAGIDFLEMEPPSFEDLSDLGALCPGCFVVGDPVIPIKGVPVEDSPLAPGEDLGKADTAIMRLTDTNGLDINGFDQIPIQIVELHLQSVQPFQVNCNGDIQMWMLDITIDPPAQPTGQMTITKTHANGGTFDFMFEWNETRILTRIDDCPQTITCEATLSVTYTTSGAPWSYTPDVPVLAIPGVTSNFVAGVSTGPTPKSAGIVPFLVVSGSDVRVYSPALPPVLTRHTWQPSVHFTFWLHNQTPAPLTMLRMSSPRAIQLDPLGAPDPTVYLKSSSICDLTPFTCPPASPTAWTRVNWDSLDVNYRNEAWWYFPGVPPPDTISYMAPEMDIVFSLPEGCPIDPAAGIAYEVDWFAFSGCTVVDSGVFLFTCPPPPGTPTGFNNPVPEIRVGGRMLRSNQPNPFNPSTEILFELEKSGEATLEVYNLQGELVRTLVKGRREAGLNRVVWDGKNNQGRDMPSGTYFTRINAADRHETRKMILVK